MMEISDPRLRSLLRQAERVAASGKRAAAESLYRQILEEAPEAEAAWLGLADVLVDDAEKTAVYQRILEIDPGNKTALAALNHEPAHPVPPADDWVKQALDKPQAKTAVPQPEPEPESVATAVAQPVPEEFNLFCYRHPDRETSLRCYTCGKPICTECAVKTPVGYSCPDCIRDLRKGYYTAGPIDYIIVFLVTLPTAMLAAFLINLVSFFIFLIIFIGPVVGTLIGRVAFWSVRRRRGQYIPHLVAATVVLGTLVAWVFGAGAFLWLAIYAVLAAGSAYYFVKV